MTTTITDLTIEATTQHIHATVEIHHGTLERYNKKHSSHELRTKR